RGRACLSWRRDSPRNPRSDRDPKSGLRCRCIQAHTGQVSALWTREQEEAHRRLLAAARSLSVDEHLQIAVRAGISTADGELTEPYREECSYSATDRDE